MTTSKREVARISRAQGFLSGDSWMAYLLNSPVILLILAV